MSKLYKFNGKTIAAITAVVILLILTFQLKAVTYGSFVSSSNNAYLQADTVPAKPPKPATAGSLKPAAPAAFNTSPGMLQMPDTTGKRDSVVVNTIDTIKVSKDSLDAPVKYAAEDSGVLIITTKDFYLYGKATTDYKDMQMEAATIEFNQEKQQVKAKGSSDTSANSLNKASFKQAEMVSLSDSMTYSLKSQKGITYNTYYNEGEIFVNAQKLKKVDTNVFFAYRAQFTTCNLDSPHFAFRTRKMKLINNKIGVSGPAHPEFEGVPVPIYIPFGIYPLNRGRHSGILVPTFNSSEDFGLGLEGLGYYKVLNDYVDVTVRSNLYSYGGWNLTIAPKYLVRYRFTGNLNLAIQKSRILNRNNTSVKDEFIENSSYMINWSHTRDNRARPGTTFSANVNFGSTKYNTYILNNPYQNFNNQLNSSIAYTKTWNNKYNLTLNLNHDQNNRTRLVNVSFPNATFSVVTFYPFQKKEQVGNGKWYEKIGVGYNGSFQNRVSFYDTAFSTRRLLDTLQWGADHNIPITLSLPSLGPVTIAPSVSYQQRWHTQKVTRTWDAVNDTLLTNTQKGFYPAHQMSFGISANTRIFGTYLFKNGRVKAIRHEVRPNIGFSYKPDLMSKYYYDVQVDTFGRKLRFSQFEGGLFGSYSEGNFGGLTFGVDNLLEMKVRDKNDTSQTADKKVRLIDGFGFSSSYNLMADSFALGNFNLYLRSTLFEKVNITASANLDPYAIDNQGFRKNRLMFKDGKLGRITNGSLAVSTNFQSKSKEGDDTKSKGNNTNLPLDPYLTPDEQQRQLEYVRQNPAEFTDFNIPWRIDLSYSLSFTRVLKSDYTGYRTDIFSSINFNGDFSLAPKWKVGATGYYDVKAFELQQLSMFITREMHCWQLTINVTPIGLYKSFSIFLSPKSGILRDLKINRSRTFSNL
jgi:hypothetical protein